MQIQVNASITIPQVDPGLKLGSVVRKDGWKMRTRVLPALFMSPFSGKSC